MANKNILVSNNGKYEPISASVDDVTGVLSSSLPVTANTSSFVAQSGIMEVYGGRLMPVGNTSVSNPQTNYSGSVLGYDASEGFGPSRTGDVSFSGDISGNTVSGIRVRNISNVTGGILQGLYGGTGAGSFSSNSLITTNGSELIPSAPNKIITATSNNFVSGDTALLNFFATDKSIVYLYTGSTTLGVSTTLQWNKPNGKFRFVRVICQAPGGGGASGSRGYPGSSDGNGGGGGGGGGLSDLIFNFNSLPSTVSITIGPVGAGGIKPTGTQSSGPGGTGGNSSFGSFLISYGGSGAPAFGTTSSGRYVARPGGSGGLGYTRSGGVGGSGTIYSTPAGNISAAFGGAGGGGGARAQSGAIGANGGSVSGIALGGTNPAVAPTSAKSIKFKECFVNNIYTNDMPNFIGGGGGGGGNRGLILSTNGLFGSGGGGGAGFQSSGSNVVAGAGAAGGAGYVLIICY